MIIPVLIGLALLLITVTVVVICVLVCVMKRRKLQHYIETDDSEWKLMVGFLC